MRTEQEGYVQSWYIERGAQCSSLDARAKETLIKGEEQIGGAPQVENEQGRLEAGLTSNGQRDPGQSDSDQISVCCRHGKTR